MSDDARKASEEQQDTTTAAVVDTPAAPEPKDDAPKDLRDVLDDPEPAPVADEVVTPGDGEAAPAVASTEPVDTAGGKAAEPVVADEPPAPQIEHVTDADGNVTAFKLGKYQAATLEELVVKVENGRRNAEKLVGKKKEELAEDPFLLADEFNEDDFELVDDADFGKQVGAGVLEALQQAGITQQQGFQPDPYAQKAQALQVAQQAIDSVGTTDEEFRAVLSALIVADPNDAASRQAVLDEWAERRPAVAAAEAAQIQVAFARHQETMAQQAYYQEQQQALAMQQQEAERAQQSVAEYRYGQETFVSQHPDWQQRNDAMNTWLQQNAWLMDAAKQAPLVDEHGRRARAEAVHRVLKMAYDAAGPVAGVGGGVSEHGGNMTSVTPSHDTNIAAAEQARIAQQRDLAGLETGAMVDDVSISVANQSPPGLAETSTFDLIGLRTVGG